MTSLLLNLFAISSDRLLRCNEGAQKLMFPAKPVGLPASHVDCEALAEVRVSICEVRVSVCKVGLYGRPASLETKLNEHREKTTTYFCATHRMGEIVFVGIQKPLNEHKFEERPSPEGGCYGTARQIHHVRSPRNVSLAAPRPLEVSIRPRNEPDVGSKLSTDLGRDVDSAVVEAVFARPAGVRTGITSLSERVHRLCELCSPLKPYHGISPFNEPMRGAPFSSG